MGFSQRNALVTLIVHVLIAGFFGVRVSRLVAAGMFEPAPIFRLWAIVIGAVILLTIVGIILTAIGSAVGHAVRTGKEPTDGEFSEDERDKLIDLKGTRAAYVAGSLASLGAMLHFVFLQDGLWLFTLLIAAGLIGQIAGEVSKLIRYRQGV
jgi:hypothetical protein